LVSRADQTIDTAQIAEQWDRMGQLYGSLKTGHVTASVTLRRLVGFSEKNRFYRANLQFFPTDLSVLFHETSSTSFLPAAGRPPPPPRHRKKSIRTTAY
jgi:hypothetical protein